MLKGLAVTFMICILSFNWYGYDLLVKILESHYDTQLEIALDNHNYEASEIIELDAKVILPYVADMSNFERVDGEVMINGVYYKFIERKYENGRIIYRCIPNANKIKLHHARSTFYQLMNEIQDTSNRDKQPFNPVSVKKTLSDYDLQNVSVPNFSLLELLKSRYNSYSPNTTDPYFGINSPPPEHV